MTKRTILYIGLIFIFINVAMHILVEINSKQRIEMALRDSMSTLKTHYEILLYTQNISAQGLYNTTIKSEKFLQIMADAKNASKDQRAILRKEMQELLYDTYERAKAKGVLQYHFIFPDNIVFLRMHKPSKFGDDLTNVRDDFRYVNKTKKQIRGFTQGKTTHAFRNSFPIFGKEGQYLGGMEISFSSENFQEYLTNISHIHTHFLVDKDIFDAKAWNRDDMISQYSQSAEHQNLMIAITKEHTKEECIVKNILKLNPIRESIDIKIEKGEDFSTYVKNQDHINVLSFLAVKNIQNKTVAWLVSHTQSEFINFTLLAGVYIREFVLLFSLIIVYFVIQHLRDTDKQERQAKDQEEILRQKIDEALEENTKQLQMLQQQSKMASMGEMIGAIAHQWRQPLNELGLSIQNLKYDYRADKIDEKFIKEFIDYNKNTIMFMSRTIDDFRSFFRVDKVKQDFNVKETTKSVVTMQSAQLKNHKISVTIEGDEFVYHGLQSEYQQVILNIISNAKDAFIENSIEDPTIKIKLKDNRVTIKDNGGGIPEDIIDRVFEPYFTTKEQGKGTGMGLYMSKMIIEDNMGGSMYVANENKGTLFTVDLNIPRYVTIPRR